MTAAVSHAFERVQPPMDQGELKRAFHKFNEMSQQLSDSYAFLENKVEELSGELATTSAQRMHELAEKEKLADQLESLLSMLPAGVLQLDEKGVVTQCNPAAEDLLLGTSDMTSLVGQRWRDLIRKCFKPRMDDGHEISLVDGRRVSLRTAAMTNECGQLVLLTDMTETRALQTQLAQHERLSAMGKMVASLAHQIRTPLAAATLYAGHLSSEQIADPLRVQFASKLQDRLHHLESQVRDMLIFARGEAPLNDQISLSELMQGIEAAMEVPLANRQAQSSIELALPEQELTCNKDALISAMMNLVNNALEATTSEIHIWVNAKVEADHKLHLQVVDNGPGLSQQERERIAEPFFTTKSNGTGLGLAVVQAVAKAHGGEFSVSDSPYGGLLAELILPLN